MSLALTWLDRLRNDQIADALALLAAAQKADGVPAISEAAMLRLGSHSRSCTGMHLLARDAAGTLVGYAGLDEHSERRTAEFVVHPEHRRRGIGGALLDALFDRVQGPLWVWAHGEHPAALRLVERAGLVSRRELLQ